MLTFSVELLTNYETGPDIFFLPPRLIKQLSLIVSIRVHKADHRTIHQHKCENTGAMMRFLWRPSWGLVHIGDPHMSLLQVLFEVFIYELASAVTSSCLSSAASGWCWRKREALSLYMNYRPPPHNTESCIYVSAEDSVEQVTSGAVGGLTPVQVWWARPVGPKHIQLLEASGVYYLQKRTTEVLLRLKEQISMEVPHFARWWERCLCWIWRRSLCPSGPEWLLSAWKTHRCPARRCSTRAWASQQRDGAKQVPFNIIYPPQENKQVKERSWLSGGLVLTSGLNGGSTSPASSILKLIFLKKGCDCTSLPPDLWQPSLCFGFLVSSCSSKKPCPCHVLRGSLLSHSRLMNSPANRFVSPPGWTFLRTPPGPTGSSSPSLTCPDALRGLGTEAFLPSFHKSGSRGPTSQRSPHNACGRSPQELKSQ